MKISPLASALLVALAIPTAHAAPTWEISPTQSVLGPGCGQGVQTATEAKAGYRHDGPLKTGYTDYVFAFARNVNCTGDFGLSIDVFLPPGASFAIDSMHPVFCLRNKTGNTGASPTPIPTANCSQTPLLMPNGAFRFIANGTTPITTTLAPDWFLEIQVPVVYQHATSGNFGAQISGQFTTPNSPLTPVLPITVAYEAQVGNLSLTNVTATSARFNYTVMDYFEGGAAMIDIGLAANSLPSTTASVALASGFVGSNVFQDINLVPNTTYFWRARFQKNGGGTFTSAVQSFTTGTAPPSPLTVTLAGNASGARVTSSVGGIDCSYGLANCNASFAYGTWVTLTANARLPVSFAGWSGACTGLGTCTVFMGQAQNVTATFSYDRNPVPLPIDPNPPRRL